MSNHAYARSTAAGERNLLTRLTRTILDAVTGRARRRGVRTRRPRVLFCTFNYAPGGTSGGAERQAQLQAEELTRRGYEVTVVCPREPGCASGEVNGVTVHRLPVKWAGRGRRPRHALMLALYLLRHLRRHDLVHVHLAGLQTEVAVPLARLFRRPVYVKVAAGGASGDVLGYASFPFLPRRFGLRHATRVQAISGQIAADLRAAGVDERRVARIPNGIVLGRFARAEGESRRALREQLGLPAGPTIVLFVGRFDRQKGLFDLIETWNDVHEDGRTLLVLVGATDWSAEDPELFRTAGVSIHGWSPRIQDYYRAADVFVLPSYSEGMSNALLEAMASGLPVIATRVGAAPEMVVHGQSGLLIEPGDLDALRGHLRDLLDDPASRRRLGAAAADAVRRYSIEAVVDQIEEEYRTLLDGRLLDRPGAGSRRW